jgi:hypothetical protein
MRKDLQSTGQIGILLVVCIFLSITGRAQNASEAATDVSYSRKGADT